MGNPILTSIANQSFSGFRLNYNQNTPPSGFEDKFYFSTQDHDNESDYIYAGSVSTATDHFDFIGLEAAMVYHVRLYRYVNGVFNYASPVGSYGGTYISELPASSLPETISFA